MNVKNRIEVLEEMVGDLVERVNELVKTNNSLVKENIFLRGKIQTDLYTKAKITKLYDNNGVVLLRLEKK